MVVDNLWLIDDDFLFRLCAKELLKEVRFAKNINLVESASTALEKLKDLNAQNEANSPELIFLDINMPEMSGWDFLDYMVANKTLDFNRTAIYILSSSFDPKDKNKAESYDILSGFLHKPLTTQSITELTEIIRRDQKLSAN